MEAKNFVLEVLNGKNKGQTFELEADVITIGRRLAPKEKKRDWILLDEPSLARIHALLQWDPDKTLYKAVIKSSSKSIVINGTSAKEGYLYHLDKLQLGDVSFRIWDGPVGSEPVEDEYEDDLGSLEPDPEYDQRRLKEPEGLKPSSDDSAFDRQDYPDNEHEPESPQPKKSSALQKAGESSVKPFSFFSGKSGNDVTERAQTSRDKKPKILGGAPPEEQKEEAEFKPISLTASYSKPAREDKADSSALEQQKPSFISGLKKNSDRSSLESVIAKRRQESPIPDDDFDEYGEVSEGRIPNRKKIYQEEEEQRRSFPESKKPSYARNNDRIGRRTGRSSGDEGADEPSGHSAHDGYDERSRRRTRTSSGDRLSSESLEDDYDGRSRRRTRPSSGDRLSSGSLEDDYDERSNRRTRPSSGDRLSSGSLEDDYDERSNRRTRPSSGDRLSSGSLEDDYDERSRRRTRPSSGDRLSSGSLEDDYDERSRRRTRPSSGDRLSSGSLEDDYDERSRRRTRPYHGAKQSSRSFDREEEERSRRRQNPSARIHDDYDDSVSMDDGGVDEESMHSDVQNNDASVSKGSSGRFLNESRIISALTGSGGDSGIFRARRESRESKDKDIPIDFSEPQVKNRSLGDDDSEPFGTIVPDTIGPEAISPLAEPVLPEKNDAPIFSGSIFDHPSAKDSVFSGYKSFINSSEGFAPESGINQRRIAASIKQKLSPKVPNKIQLPSLGKPKSADLLNVPVTSQDIPSSESVADIVRQASEGASVSAGNSDAGILTALPSGRLAGKNLGPFDDAKFQPQFSSGDSPSGIFNSPFEQSAQRLNNANFQQDSAFSSLTNPFTGEIQGMSAALSPVFSSSPSPAYEMTGTSMFDGIGQPKNSISGNDRFNYDNYPASKEMPQQPAFEMPSAGIGVGSNGQGRMNGAEESFFTRAFDKNESSGIPNMAASADGRLGRQPSSDTSSAAPVFSTASAAKDDDRKKFGRFGRGIASQEAQAGQLAALPAIPDAGNSRAGQDGLSILANNSIANTSSGAASEEQNISDKTDNISESKKSLGRKEGGMMKPKASVGDNKPFGRFGREVSSKPVLPSFGRESRPAVTENISDAHIGGDYAETSDAGIMLQQQKHNRDLSELKSDAVLKEKHSEGEHPSVLDDLPVMSPVADKSGDSGQAGLSVASPEVSYSEAGLPKLPSFGEKFDSQDSSDSRKTPSVMVGLPKLPSFGEKPDSQDSSNSRKTPSVMVGLPKLPSFGEKPDSQDSSDSRKSQSVMVGLPKLPSFGEKPDSQDSSDSRKSPSVMVGLPKLPSFGEKPDSQDSSDSRKTPSVMSGLPKLPSFGEKSDSQDSSDSRTTPSVMSGLPKLPSFGEKSDSQDSSDSRKTPSVMSGLPKLPSFGEKSYSQDSSDSRKTSSVMSGLPKLPSFGEKSDSQDASDNLKAPSVMSGLPKLPSFGEKSDSHDAPDGSVATSVISDLPKLPSFGGKDVKVESSQSEQERPSIFAGLPKLPSFSSSEGKSSIGGGLSTLPTFGESSRIVDKKEESDASSSSENKISDKKEKPARGGKIRFSGDNVFKKTVMSSAGFTNAVDADMRTSDSDMEKFLEVIQQNREENERSLESSDSSGDFISSLNKSSQNEKKGKEKLFGPASSIDLPFADYKIKIKKKEDSPSVSAGKSEAFSAGKADNISEVKEVKPSAEKSGNRPSQASSAPVTSISLPSLKKKEDDRPKAQKKKKEQYDPYGFLIQEEEPEKKPEPKKEEIFSWADDSEGFQAPASRRRGGPSSEEESSVHAVDSVSAFISDGGYRDEAGGEWTIRFTKLPGNSRLRNVDLNSDLIIGRSPAVDMQIKDSSLADRHVKIYSYEGKLYIQKLDRKKQIFINGNPLISAASRLLKEGDKIQLSDLTAFELVKK